MEYFSDGRSDGGPSVAQLLLCTPAQLLEILIPSYAAMRIAIEVKAQAEQVVRVPYERKKVPAVCMVCAKDFITTVQRRRKTCGDNCLAELVRNSNNLRRRLVNET